MKSIKISNEGFTLIELLVVVAIIGILASVVLVFLNSARARGDDAAVKTNLHTVANEAGIFYSDNGNSYGDNFASSCPLSSNPSSTNMFSKDKAMFAAIAEATKRGNGNYCYASANGWAVSVGLKEAANTSWCVDSEGAAIQINSAPSSAINEFGVCAQPAGGTPPVCIPSPGNPCKKI